MKANFLQRVIVLYDTEHFFTKEILKKVILKMLQCNAIAVESKSLPLHR